ncbi:MAG: carotenoid 1,2-hydratase, partial [Pseudomonadota bacterium]
MMRKRAFALQGCLLALLALGACTEEAAQTAAPGGALRVGAVLGETDATGFALADAPRSFSFPRDHGPHSAFRSEWWYLTATLEDASAAEFGVQFTLFRQAVAPPLPEQGAQDDNRWATPQVFLGHLAVTDVARGDHREAERFARGHPALAGARAEPFAVWLEDWRLFAEDDGDGWRLQASSGAESGDFAIDLRLASDAPVYFQGEQGLSRKGPGQASYYYSMPRMAASGTVMLDDRAVQVRGTGWLDREWSTSVLSAGQLGWDWFALKLDDGRSLMAFQLRREDGQRDPFDQGLLV